MWYQWQEPKLKSRGISGYTQGNSNLLGKIISVVVFLAITGCVSQIDKKAIIYDFDHGVNYQHQQLTPSLHQLIVRSDSDIPFAVLSTFVVQHAVRLCGSAKFTIQYLKGVQPFNQLDQAFGRRTPRPYEPDLEVQVHCGLPSLGQQAS